MNIMVERQKLIEILQHNRAEHRDIFLEAQNKFRELVVEELEKSLQDARNGKRIRTNLQLLAPVDQTAEYDKTIRMLELASDDLIQLSEHEFECYVMDRWSWKNQWSMSNMPYSTKLQQMSGE